MVTRLTWFTGERSLKDSRLNLNQPLLISLPEQAGKMLHNKENFTISKLILRPVILQMTKSLKIDFASINCLPLSATSPGAIAMLSMMAVFPMRRILVLVLR